MRFSVYMACHNAEDYIDQAINSVLAQTYADFQLVIVDDFSSDSTWEKIQILANIDPRIKHFRNSQKKCIGYSKSFACGRSDGEILVMVDGDDFIAPNALAVLNDAYNTYPQYECIYSNHYICDKYGTPLRKSGWVSQYPIDGSIGQGGGKRTDKVGHLVSFKNDAYHRTEGYGRDRRHATDKQLISRLEEVCRFKFLNIPLYYYRRVRTKAEDAKAKILFQETAKRAARRESGLSVIISHSGSKRLSLLSKTLDSIVAPYNLEIIVSLSDSAEDKVIANTLNTTWKPNGRSASYDLKAINTEGLWTEHEDGEKTFSVGRARNSGVRKASYRRLFFLDSDILVPNNFYELCLNNIKYNQAWLPIVRNDDGPSERTDTEGFRLGGFGNAGIMKRDFYFIDKFHEFDRWGYEDNLFCKKLEINKFNIIREKCHDLVHQFHEGAALEGWTVPYPVRKKFIDDKVEEYLKDIKYNPDNFLGASGGKARRRKVKRIRVRNY